MSQAGAMTRSLFITGFNGFLGRHFLRHLDFDKYGRVYCLTRKEHAPGSRATGIRTVRGDLNDTRSYLPYLSDVDVVVHLAATTGKASADEYDRTNRQGTESLLASCRSAGVKHFLHVSSIAAKFAATPYYYYARSKRRAEDAVRGSGVGYVIVRPTIVIARDAPIWRRLQSMGRAPLILVVGDGQARIQPVYVDDISRCLHALLAEERFRDEVIEFGGPEIVTIEEFLRRIHRLHHKREPRVIHVPYLPIVRSLAALEPYAFGLLPITAGQLASFVNDGVVDPNPVHLAHSHRMKNVDEMLRLAVAG